MTLEFMRNDMVLRRATCAQVGDFGMVYCVVDVTVDRRLVRGVLCPVNVAWQAKNRHNNNYYAVPPRAAKRT